LRFYQEQAYLKRKWHLQDPAFETLSSSGPFQELTSLPSFHFDQSLSSSSSSLGTKVFDKLITLVLMGKSEISASLGILQGKSFNNRLLRDIIFKKIGICKSEPFLKVTSGPLKGMHLQSSFKFWSFLRAYNFSI